MTPGLGTLLADEFRFLTFRSMGPEIRQHREPYFFLGLAFAWLAGIGRYWDHPRAAWWQYAGFGSVVYVFVLAALLWVILRPLRPRNGSFGNVLTFVAMTSPPAILYAIPVERFLDAEAASSANVWFLLAVAAWRVALWAVFLRRVAGLGPGTTFVATCLPIALVVVALAALNLQHAVFSIMGGNQGRAPNAFDDAYAIVVLLSSISVLSILPLLFAYAFTVEAARRRSPPPPEKPAPEPARMNDGVVVRPSARHGTGLFTTRAFRKGSTVYSVPRGQIVRGAEIAGLTPVERNHLDRVGEDQFEVIAPPGCHINHSCEPNVEERKRWGVALRDLAAGEEITLDYDRIAHLDAPFPCNCGAAACRGLVRGRA
ncbi:MAG TPA: SET domain-containing protein-lysine N-methyltransferase [Planctomycetota bacterium]|nr:SET domain-containing protein-lysine N-methyltransferase [Planctomycetota bacterium]